MTSIVRSKSNKYLNLTEKIEEVLRKKYPEPLDYKELAKEVRHDRQTVLKALVLLALQGKIRVFPKENGLMLVAYRPKATVSIGETG